MKICTTFGIKRQNRIQSNDWFKAHQCGYDWRNMANAKFGIGNRWFSRKICFTTMHFCNAYWQMPWDIDSRSTCGTIFLQRLFTSTRVLQGLNNATANFQTHIPWCFQSMHQAFKSWLDDFIIYTEDTNDLLKHFGQCFSTCNEYILKLCPKKCKFFKERGSSAEG